jgi:hypothetical protein
MCGK